MASSEEKRRNFPIQIIAIPALIVVVVFTVVYLHTESDQFRSYPLTTYNLTIPDDSVSIEHGKRIFTIRGCSDCHGENAAGRIIESGLLTGIIVAPNLTPGKGSAIKDFSTSDIVRVIREGVKPNGKSVIIMPSHKFQVIHKRDIESLIAYLKSVKPVDRKLPKTNLNFPIRFYYFINRKVALFPANMIRRPVQFPDVDPDNRIAKGKYLATVCVGCHGHYLKGGAIPGAPPYWPKAPDLTSTGDLSHWTKEQFVKTMKEGITPDDLHLDKEYMPWPAVGQLTDEEFELLWDYLQTL